MSTGQYVSPCRAGHCPMLGVSGCKTLTAFCGAGVLLALLGARRKRAAEWGHELASSESRALLNTEVSHGKKIFSLKKITLKM